MELLPISVIYVGNGFMVHRPTKDYPVEKVEIARYHGGTKFVEGRRVKS